MNARFHLAFSLLFAATGVGCAEHLATIPPSDHYLVSEPGTPKLDDDQKEFVDNVNKELAKFGIVAATPGKYEMDVAAMAANLYLSKMWHGSGRKIADQSATPGAKTGGAILDGGTYAPLYPVSDEPDSNDVKTIHLEQQLYARGVPYKSPVAQEVTDFPRSQPNSDEIAQMVNTVRPKVLFGRLKIGVARLAEKGDSKVIFVLLLRDERLFVTSAPPRTTPPGATFELAGQIVDKSLASMRLGLLQPDGVVQMRQVDAHEDGTFSTSVELPKVPGLYVLTLAGNGYAYALFNVPIFVGVDPTPWPPHADPAAPPIDGSRALAQQLASGVNNWRVAHKMAPIDVDAKLSGIARTEAGRTATALAKARGDQPITQEVANELETMSPEAKSELAAAGFELSLVHHYYESHFDDKVPNWIARLPWDAIAAASIGSPDAQHFGVGVVMAQKNDRDDPSSVLYVIDWLMVVRPSAEKPAETVIPDATGAAPPAPATAPPPAVAPATTPAAPPTSTPETPAAPPPPPPTAAPGTAPAK